MFILGKGPQKAKRWRKKSPVAERRGNCTLIPRFSLEASPLSSEMLGLVQHSPSSQPIRMESFPKFHFSPVQSIGGAGFFYNRLKYGCIIGIFSDMNAQDLNPISCSVQFSSVQFSHSVVSDSLRPHELQHARPPCPSPTPRVYSNSCPSSR